MKDIKHWFEERRDKLVDVEKAAMDMSASYGSLAVMYMPNAEICYDHYHVIATMNKAVDEVRKSAQTKIVNEEDRRMFFRSRMAFLYGEENLPDHLRFKFEKAKSISAPTARAWEIKELLRGLWRITPEESELAAYFKKWFWRATHSRLEPVRKAAKTLKRSATPKYCGGTAPVPTEPISIMQSAAAAQPPIPRTPIFLQPAIIRRSSEAMDSSTTSAVTAMCIPS